MNVVTANELFYYKPLFEVENYKDVIGAFEIKRKNAQGLAVYIREYAVEEEKDGVARTYLVMDRETDELVGYFSLKAGDITVNERKNNRTGMVEFDSVPGVELSNFAVNDVYRKAHGDVHGIGFIILIDFVIPLIEEVSRHIGIKVLYIFALPDEQLISRYIDMGFSRLSSELEEALHNRIKPSYDMDCIFMYRIIEEKTTKTIEG